jgi:23S rRNA pseudouridine1911/1915/1917 synthase
MAVNVPRAREAATNIEVLERLKGYVLVAARLETGRTHQIRVHMANRGNPVLGDVVYGAARQNFGGQVLHAGELKLVHPLSGEGMEFVAPLPEYFVEVLRKVGGKFEQS